MTCNTRAYSRQNKTEGEKDAARTEICCIRRSWIFGTAYHYYTITTSFAWNDVKLPHEEWRSPKCLLTTLKPHFESVMIMNYALDVQLSQKWRKTSVPGTARFHITDAIDGRCQPCRIDARYWYMVWMQGQNIAWWISNVGDYYSVRCSRAVAIASSGEKKWFGILFSLNTICIGSWQRLDVNVH